MSRIRHLCPVCRKGVTPTSGHNICGHMDKAGHPCPASFDLPYDLTIAVSASRSDFDTQLAKARHILTRRRYHRKDTPA